MKEAVHGGVAVQLQSSGCLSPKQTQTPAHFSYDSILTSFPEARNNETKYRISPQPSPRLRIQSNFRLFDPRNIIPSNSGHTRRHTHTATSPSERQITQFMCRFLSPYCSIQGHLFPKYISRTRPCHHGSDPSLEIDYTRI